MAKLNFQHHVIFNILNPEKMSRDPQKSF